MLLKLCRYSKLILDRLEVLANQQKNCSRSIGTVNFRTKSAEIKYHRLCDILIRSNGIFAKIFSSLATVSQKEFVSGAWIGQLGQKQKGLTKNRVIESSSMNLYTHGTHNDTTTLSVSLPCWEWSTTLNYTSSVVVLWGSWPLKDRMKVYVEKQMNYSL